MAFTNILAKYPGSTHYAYSWSSSEISFLFETWQIVDRWLFGAVWRLSLAAMAVNTTAEPQVYKRHHKTAGCVIERELVLLKMCFRCLHDTGRSTYIIIIIIVAVYQPEL